MSNIANSSAVDLLGRVGRRHSIEEWRTRTWDAIVVGAGHNGLVCAIYLARAGKKVLVLEGRERVGGACTLEEPWPGFRISPCAYVAGLLHPLIIEELNLTAHGFEWVPAEGGLFVPFDDGSSVQLWDDHERCDEEIKKLCPGDVRGWHALHELMGKVCDAIRPPNSEDMWIGPAPTREMIESRLRGDKDAISLVFDWSMAEFVERYLEDERLHQALMGQGVIGTFASPLDAGTASIYLHHYSGRMDGKHLGDWGYVKGGMGMISFILSDIATDLGVEVAAGTTVSRIIPGEGVELMTGERIAAITVVSNADPIATLKLLGDSADGGWRRSVERVPMVGSVVKVNLALEELPNFRCRPGIREPHHLANINTPLTKKDWQSCYDAARAGELYDKLWTEIYLQSAFDESVTPHGKHVMSVFCTHVPYEFRSGDWDSRRDQVYSTVISSIGRFCSNIPGAIIASDTLGPPDIEKKVGLTGGHIFQGECLPQYMWSNRLKPRTPMPGVFLCGASTHPGGSVIGINGRNAAMEILSQ